MLVGVESAFFSLDSLTCGIGNPITIIEYFSDTTRDDLVTAFNGSTTYSSIQSDSEFIISFEPTDRKDTFELDTEINIKASMVKTLTISCLPVGSIIEEGQFFITSTSEENIVSARGQMLSKQSGSTWIPTSQWQQKNIYIIYLNNQVNPMCLGQIK